MEDSALVFQSRDGWPSSATCMAFAKTVVKSGHIGVKLVAQKKLSACPPYVSSQASDSGTQNSILQSRTIWSFRISEYSYQYAYVTAFPSVYKSSKKRDSCHKLSVLGSICLISDI